MATTNSAFRTETRDEHLYNRIELFNRSSSPIDAPAANRYQNCREQQPTENQIATGRCMYSDYRTESNNEHLYNNIQSINEPSSPGTESQAAYQTSHCSFRHTQRRVAALNALNSAFRAESSYENLYDHIELSNMQSLPRCLPSGAPPVNQAYQEEAVYQNYEGHNRPVASNSAFRAEPKDEHLYNHIELSNRQPVPSGSPAANQIYQEEAANQNYEGNNRAAATNSAFRADPNDEHLYNHIELSNRQPVPSGSPAANQIYQGEAANQIYERNNRPQEPMKNIAICHRMPFAVIAVLVLFLLATVGASISLAIMTYSDGNFLVNSNVANSYNSCF